MTTPTTSNLPPWRLPAVRRPNPERFRVRDPVADAVVTPRGQRLLSGQFYWHTDETRDPFRHPVLILRQHSRSKALALVMNSFGGRDTPDNKFAYTMDPVPTELFYVPIKTRIQQEQYDSRPLLHFYGSRAVTQRLVWLNLSRIVEIDPGALEPYRQHGCRLRDDSLVDLLEYMQWLIDANIHPAFNPFKDSLSVRKEHLKMILEDSPEECENEEWPTELSYS